MCRILQHRPLLPYELLHFYSIAKETKKYGVMLLEPAAGYGNDKLRVFESSMPVCTEAGWG